MYLNSKYVLVFKWFNYLSILFLFPVLMQSNPNACRVSGWLIAKPCMVYSYEPHINVPLGWFQTLMSEGENNKLRDMEFISGVGENTSQVRLVLETMNGKNNEICAIKLINKDTELHIQLSVLSISWLIPKGLPEIFIIYSISNKVVFEIWTTWLHWWLPIRDEPETRRRQDSIGPPNLWEEFGSRSLIDLSWEDC